MPDPISAGIQVGVGLAKTAVELINAGKAKKEAKRLKASRPQYEINPLAQAELDFQESELANGGLSARAETAYNNLNNQQFASSLSSILKGGGSVGNVADVFGENQEGRQRLALLSDQMRLGQIDRVSRSRQMMIDQQDKEWQINVDAPWKDAAQANARARQGAEEGIWSGIDTIGAGAMNYAGQAYNEGQYDKYFGKEKWGAGDTEFNPSSYNGRVGGIPPLISGTYNMQQGNQLDYISPTLGTGINPNGGGTNYNWYRPGG